MRSSNTHHIHISHMHTSFGSQSSNSICSGRWSHMISQQQRPKKKKNGKNCNASLSFSILRAFFALAKDCNIIWVADTFLICLLCCYDFFLFFIVVHFPLTASLVDMGNSLYDCHFYSSFVIFGFYHSQLVVEHFIHGPFYANRWV